MTATLDQERRSKSNGAFGPARRFELIMFDNLKPGREQLYLVKRLIPRVGLTLVWGPPKCGKSFWVFDLMMHVALGWDYRDHRARQGTVVYCAFEGAEGFKLRAEAFRVRHEPPPIVPFFLVGAVMDLVLDHGNLAEAIGDELGDERPAAVVLDTLNRSLRGSEASDEDMASYIRAADAIREVFECAVIVVHHCGHDAQRPRGHSSLLGAVDSQIAVTRDGDNNIVATVERMKDGPEGAVVASRLEQVDIDVDEDGEPITSCIVVPADAAAPRRSKVRVPGSAKIALDLLQRAIADSPEPAPASNHIPPGSVTTTVSLWRRYCYEGTITESDERDAKRQAFNRASKSLQSLGIIGVWGDHVWIA
jgi:hypothetical protein